MFLNQHKGRTNNLIKYKGSSCHPTSWGCKLWCLGAGPGPHRHPCTCCRVFPLSPSFFWASLRMILQLALCWMEEAELNQLQSGWSKAWFLQTSTPYDKYKIIQSQRYHLKVLTGQFQEMLVLLSILIRLVKV